jgi:DNA polymerase-1
MPPLFIILDANSIMHRSYHAIPPLTTRDGELVNAVFGFASILMTIFTQDKPAYIAATFDTKAPTFRHEMYKEYKAGRKKAPDDFYTQIPRIEEVVKTLNIPIYKQAGVEADDLIGTIVTINEKKHASIQNKIITSDMDAMQLVTDKTRVGNLHKGYRASESFSPEDVIAKYGIRPDQVVDYKAIQGDSSDNIPGVKGIGKIGAQRLLEAYETLDGVYDHLGEIKGKKQEYLREQKEQAYFSQELAQIKCDVDVDYKLEDCKAHDFDADKVIKLFDSLQFYSLIRRLNNWKKTHGIQKNELSEVFSIPKESPKKKSINQDSLF